MTSIIIIVESPVRNQQATGRHGKSGGGGETPNFEELKRRIYDTLIKHREGLLIQQLPEEYEVIILTGKHRKLIFPYDVETCEHCCILPEIGIQIHCYTVLKLIQTC